MPSRRGLVSTSLALHFYLQLLLSTFWLSAAWIPYPSLSSPKIALTNHNMVAKEKALPEIPLPDPIYSTTPGTWAFDTMSRRVNEEILQRTWEDNKEMWSTDKFKDVLNNFQALRKQLTEAATTKLSYLDPLPEDASEERKLEWQEWHDIMEPFVSNDDTWLTAPWMVTEFYVYRLLMQTIGYWDKNSAGYMYDPFLEQKRAGLRSSVTSAENMLEKIPNLPKTSSGLEIAAGIALWGNKMDLSIWPADAETANQDVFTEILSAATENLLHDDSANLADHCDRLRDNGGGNIDIIVDNAGFELVTDLALAQHLVESGIAKCVTFQLKSHPTFVSDALEKDLLETVDYYCDLDEAKYPNARRAGLVWRSFLENGSWKCSENSFWVQGAAMWEMPDRLSDDLSSRCSLAFVKGDANYRRLLGDRLWDYSAPFEKVVGAYFPCPVCALRTLKAELGCGMDSSQVDRARILDKNWMVNGRFGVVQFAPGRK